MQRKASCSDLHRPSNQPRYTLTLSPWTRAIDTKTQLLRWQTPTPRHQGQSPRWNFSPSPPRYATRSTGNFSLLGAEDLGVMDDQRQYSSRVSKSTLKPSPYFTARTRGISIGQTTGRQENTARMASLSTSRRTCAVRCGPGKKAGSFADSTWRGGFAYT